MTGLILKDFLVLKKTLRYYVFLMAVYAFFALTGTFTYSIISGFAVMLGAMGPMSAFAYDEQARWDKFAGASPVGRKGVVTARYLFALILLGVGGVVAALVSLGVTWFGKAQVSVWWEPLAVSAAICLVGLLLDSVILPVIFKFGSEKSRVISMIIFVTCFGGMALLSWLTEKGSLDLSGLDKAVTALPPALLLAAPVMIAALLFWISYHISVGIYLKKEL
mgnify:CR=1 FL=1